MPSRGTEHKHQMFRVSLALAALVAAVLGAAALGWWAISGSAGTPLSGFGLSVQDTDDLIRSWGGWGVAGSISLMVAHSFIPFPAEILAIANGMVYGAFWGTVITWAGAMLGAFLAFGLTRLFGRPFVKMVVSASNWERLDTWSKRQGGVTLLISRLIPVIAFNLINYAAGLTTISCWTFAWATGLGILPLTVLMAVMGARMTEIPWWLWPLLAALAVAAWWAWRRVARRGA